MTPFGVVLDAIGIAYWLLALVGIVVALRWPKKQLHKALAVAAVIVLFGSSTLVTSLGAHLFRNKLDKSMALFRERCKTAGEKINRTVEGVDGVVWMKWRERYSSADASDQFKLDDPYGKECGGEDCIAGLLRVTSGLALNPDEAKRKRAGYRFVETSDPRDGRRYRYSVGLEQGWNPEAVERYRKEKGSDPPAFSYQLKVRRVPIDAFSVHYGVIWDDVSTREDREHWIAGGALKVIDLQTNDVMAQRVGYMIDRGQGSLEGFRSPWLHAVQTACPEFPHELHDSAHGRTLHETLDFVVKALHPREME